MGMFRKIVLFAAIAVCLCAAVLIAESFICGIAVRYFNMDIFGYFDILGYVMYFATYYIGMPIRALWGLII